MYGEKMKLKDDKRRIIITGKEGKDYSKFDSVLHTENDDVLYGISAINVEFSLISMWYEIREIHSPDLPHRGIWVNSGSLPANPGDLTCMITHLLIIYSLIYFLINTFFSTLDGWC